MTVFKRDFILNDNIATRELGARLTSFLKPGDVVALNGELGAGKTSLVRGFIQSLLGEDYEVPSPTYTLIQTYDTPIGEVWHGDMYRLERPEDCEELGLIDAFEEAICLFEWPNKLGDYWPKHALELELKFKKEGRLAILSGTKDWIKDV